MILENDMISLNGYLKTSSDRIEIQDRDLYVYLVILHKTGIYYSTILEFFYTKLKGDKNNDQLHKLPKDFDEVLAKGVIRDKLRQNALNIAINSHYISAITDILSLDASSIVINKEQLYGLYKISSDLVLKAIEEKIKVDRSHQSNFSSIFEYTNQILGHSDIVDMM